MPYSRARFLGPLRLIEAKLRSQPGKYCKAYGHRRSKAEVAPLGSSWRSKCRRCGTPLVRIKQGRWVPLSELRSHAAAMYGPAFSRAWPVDQSICFEELLQAIDDREGTPTADARQPE